MIAWWSSHAPRSRCDLPYPPWPQERTTTPANRPESRLPQRPSIQSRRMQSDSSFFGRHRMLTDQKRLTISRAGVFGVAAALVAVAVVFFVAKASGDRLSVSPEFGSGPPEELGLFVALMATVSGGLVGMAFAWLARRFTPRPMLAFLIMCAVGLVGYGIVAFVRSETTSTALWLNGMHLAAAIPIVGLLAYALRTPSPRRRTE